MLTYGYFIGIILPRIYSRIEDMLTNMKLHQILSYDRETGDFRWIKAQQNRLISNGEIAGTVNKQHGYRKIKIEGRAWMGHILAWLYVHGELPKSRIYHLNGNPSDNRIINLVEYSVLRKTPLTQKLLKEMIHYDEKTGAFKWNKPQTLARYAHVGEQIGFFHKSSGYMLVKIFGRSYPLHRLAWFYVRGKWPTTQIDHVNRIKTDNRLENLRDVSHRENMRNKGKPDKTLTAVDGVLHIGDGIWRAFIFHFGNKIDLGEFKTFDLAKKARLKAEKKLFPEAFVARV